MPAEPVNPRRAAVQAAVRKQFAPSRRHGTAKGRLDREVWAGVGVCGSSEGVHQPCLCVGQAHPSLAAPAAPLTARCRAPRLKSVRLRTAAPPCRSLTTVVSPGIHIHGLQSRPTPLTCSQESLRIRPPELTHPGDSLNPLCFGSRTTPAGGGDDDDSHERTGKTYSVGEGNALMGSFVHAIRQQNVRDKQNAICARDFAARMLQSFCRRLWRRNPKYGGNSVPGDFDGRREHSTHLSCPLDSKLAVSSNRPHGRLFGSDILHHPSSKASSVHLDTIRAVVEMWWEDDVVNIARDNACRGLRRLNDVGVDLQGITTAALVKAVLVAGCEEGLSGASECGMADSCSGVGPSVQRHARSSHSNTSQRHTHEGVPSFFFADEAVPADIRAVASEFTDNLIGTCSLYAVLASSDGRSPAISALDKVFDEKADREDYRTTHSSIESGAIMEGAPPVRVPSPRISAPLELMDPVVGDISSSCTAVGPEENTNRVDSLPVFLGLGTKPCPSDHAPLPDFTIEDVPYSARTSPPKARVRIHADEVYRTRSPPAHCRTPSEQNVRPSSPLAIRRKRGTFVRITNVPVKVAKRDDDVPQGQSTSRTESRAEARCLRQCSRVRPHTGLQAGVVSLFTRGAEDVTRAKSAGTVAPVTMPGTRAPPPHARRWWRSSRIDDGDATQHLTSLLLTSSPKCGSNIIDESGDHDQTIYGKDASLSIDTVAGASCDLSPRAGTSAEIASGGGVGWADQAAKRSGRRPFTTASSACMSPLNESSSICDFPRKTIGRGGGVVENEEVVRMVYGVAIGKEARPNFPPGTSKQGFPEELFRENDPHHCENSVRFGSGVGSASYNHRGKKAEDEPASRGDDHVMTGHDVAIRNSKPQDWRGSLTSGIHASNSVEMWRWVPPMPPKYLKHCSSPSPKDILYKVLAAGGGHASNAAAASTVATASSARAAANDEVVWQDCGGVCDGRDGRRSGGPACVAKRQLHRGIFAPKVQQPAQRHVIQRNGFDEGAWAPRTGEEQVFPSRAGSSYNTDDTMWDTTGRNNADIAAKTTSTTHGGKYCAWREYGVTRAQRRGSCIGQLHYQQQCERGGETEQEGDRRRNHPQSRCIAA